ncbi:hypothetical protein L1D15_12105 [Vibrio sp. Isolate25]|uniref:hypothetical protein n=1 Tax=unclassified Vibrio TaxID=2614977 RepID=UPI001EFD11E0|nr:MULTISPECIES: hypothetical protein [unclassified Vibrio]MCG9597459.1 hypothetical protein [Vibrio sp. Isolate25]MCG9678939.1 hypothetical protein [Vibrio sp. Isolate24]
MAAEKLTRSRFAQIIIMLSLLITAFIWRTLTYNEQRNVDCELKPSCTFNVKNSSINASLEGSKVIVEQPVGNWRLSSDNSQLKIENKDDNWEIELPSKEDFELTLQDLEEAQIIGIKFRL